MLKSQYFAVTVIQTLQKHLEKKFLKHEKHVPPPTCTHNSDSKLNFTKMAKKYFVLSTPRRFQSTFQIPKNVGMRTLFSSQHCSQQVPGRAGD